MIKYNLNNINKWYLGDGNPIAKMYHGTTVAYDVTGGGEPTPPTPPQSDCYGVTYPSITAYSDTTYSSVYSFTDGKWYMLNNLNQYEEYGVYDIVNDISTATTYEGKLGVVGETEYQFNNGSWSVVGTYVDALVTYTIDDTSPSPYVGQELLTTFKIPYADVEAVGYVNFRITSNDGGELSVALGGGGWTNYTYMGSGYYNGTVTNDGEYFYLSLPSEAPQSIVIDGVKYFSSTPIHLIVGSKQATVQYPEKSIPSSALTYSSVADMQAAKCPDVGVGQLCYTDGQVYRFDATEAWVVAQDSELFVTQFYDDDSVGILGCGFNDNILTSNIVQNHPSSVPAVEPTLALVIGDCVTTIDDNALYGLRNMSACTIGSGVTSIGNSAFYACGSLTSIDIPNSVTSIESWAFYGCSFTSVVIPDSVTSIGGRCFDNCSRLTNVTFGNNSIVTLGGYLFTNCKNLVGVTFNTTTPPPMPYGNTFDGSTCPIYVPSQAVNTYKSASGWSSYTSRIRAIPT